MLIIGKIITCSFIIGKIFSLFWWYLDLYDYRGYSPTWCLEKFSREGGDQGLERSLGTCKPVDEMYIRI